MGQPKQRVLTGTRPSGKPHLGNYLGAYQPAIELQKSYELFFFLADYHALNEPFTPKEITDQSLDLTATMLACGLNTEQGFFYTQSGVPDVCELAWMLACQAPFGMLSRAHSFKDAQAKGNEVNAGVFNYPVLMAADILLYDAHLVPVGQDQKQHLEIARDLGQRFNNRYGDMFKIPEPMISQAVAIVPGLDGEKMSKSKGNVIPIFATDKEWKKAVMAIKTDSKGLDDAKDPDACIIYNLFRLLAPAEKVQEMAAKLRGRGYGYGHAKLELLAVIQEKFGPMRDKYLDFMGRPDDLRDVLRAGSQKTRAVAQAKMARIRAAVGTVF